MTKQKLVVVGNSGAGKSSCVRTLAHDKKLASMDKCLGSPYPGFEACVKWIFETTNCEPILEASAHEQYYWDLALAKQRRRQDLEPILFVFLYNSNPQIRVARLNASDRREEARQLPLAWDGLINDLCRYAADMSLNTASMTEEFVADTVRLLAANFITQAGTAF